MGYYKDTGSLQSMASAEAILKKRMPEKVGILPVAELLFVAESMWVAVEIPIAPLTANIGAIQMIWSQE